MTVCIASILLVIAQHSVELSLRIVHRLINNAPFSKKFAIDLYINRVPRYSADGLRKSYANEESVAAKAANARSEQANGVTEHKDLVRILTRLPQFVLTDQSGDQVASHDLYGHVWIANFIFTQCKGSCPVQTALMNKIQNRLKESDN